MSNLLNDREVLAAAIDALEKQASIYTRLFNSKIFSATITVSSQHLNGGDVVDEMLCFGRQDESVLFPPAPKELTTFFEQYGQYLIAQKWKLEMQLKNLNPAV